MRQVAKLASLQPVHLEPGVYQQLVNLARRVFAIVPRVALAGFAGTQIGMEKAGMVPLQNGRQAAQAGDVRRGQHEVAARFEDAVHFAHQVHGVREQVLDQLAAQHGREMLVRVWKESFSASKWSISQVNVSPEDEVTERWSTRPGSP